MKSRCRALVLVTLLSPLTACVTKIPPPEPAPDIYLPIPGSFTQPARRDLPGDVDNRAADFQVPVPGADAPAAAERDALPADQRSSAIDLNAVDIGAPPQNYEDQIRAFMGSRLPNPDQVRYRFGQIPQKGRRAASEGLAVSWYVVAAISQVNANGQFDGEDRYYFFFDDGVIVDFRNFDEDLRRMSK